MIIPIKALINTSREILLQNLHKHKNFLKIDFLDCLAHSFKSLKSNNSVIILNPLG